MKLIKINNLNKTYKKGQKRVLKDINLEITSGDFIAIMGKSGSGKTTLLNTIATLDTFDNGDIIINNESIKNLTNNQAAIFRRKKLGLIFQDYKLLNSLTVEENIKLPLEILKQTTTEFQTIVQLLEIEHLLQALPNELSGGQKQRVAIARAIIKKPVLLLADEPTGALDSNNSYRIMEYLKQINQEQKLTIIMVTHDSTVAAYANKVIFLQDGQIQKKIDKDNRSNEEFSKKLAEQLVVIEEQVE